MQGLLARDSIASDLDARVNREWRCLIKYIIETQCIAYKICKT